MAFRPQKTKNKKMLHSLRRYFWLVLLISLTNCDHAKISQPVHEYRIALSKEPDTLDCRQARSLESATFCHLLFDGLYRWGDNGEPELSLAESVAIHDSDRVYTFTIRPCQWSNGDPVTAYDFEYTWKQILSPSYPSPLAYQLFVIDGAKEAKLGKGDLDRVGIRALDDHTLQVRLKTATPSFPSLLCSMSFCAVNSRLDQKDPSWAHAKDDSFVSNGPFNLKEWKLQEEIVLQESTSYWKQVSAEKRPSCALSFVISDENTALGLIESGGLDWAGSPVSQLSSEFLAQSKFQDHLQRVDAAATEFIRVNSTHPILQNIKIRQALSTAIDRDELVEQLLNGYGSPAQHLVPPCTSRQPYTSKPRKGNPKQLFEEGLEELGIAKAELPPIRLSYSSTRRHQLAQYLQAQWRKTLGLEIQIERLEAGVLYSELSELSYDLAIGCWFADYNDPVNFLEVFKYRKNGTNQTGWENPVFALLIDRSNRESNRLSRMTYLKQAERILERELPIIPIYHYEMVSKVADETIPLQVHPLGILQYRQAL